MNAPLKKPYHGWVKPLKMPDSHYLSAALGWLGLQRILIQSTLCDTRCPGCPKDAKPNQEQVKTKAALEGLLGDDEDGLAATFEDYRL